MPWVLCLQKLSRFIYELLDFVQVYGTACGVVVESVYCRLHQRNQFVRNPHRFVASRSVGFLTWLLCGRHNRNDWNNRIVLQEEIQIFVVSLDVSECAAFRRWF